MSGLGFAPEPRRWQVGDAWQYRATHAGGSEGMGSMLFTTRARMPTWKRGTGSCLVARPCQQQHGAASPPHCSTPARCQGWQSQPATVAATNSRREEAAKQHRAQKGFTRVCRARTNLRLPHLGAPKEKHRTCTAGSTGQEGCVRATPCCTGFSTRFPPGAVSACTQPRKGVAACKGLAGCIVRSPVATFSMWAHVCVGPLQGGPHRGDGGHRPPEAVPAANDAGGCGAVREVRKHAADVVGRRRGRGEGQGLGEGGGAEAGAEAGARAGSEIAQSCTRASKSIRERELVNRVTEQSSLGVHSQAVCCGCALKQVVQQPLTCCRKPRWHLAPGSWVGRNSTCLQAGPVRAGGVSAFWEEAVHSWFQRLKCQGNGSVAPRATHLAAQHLDVCQHVCAVGGAPKGKHGGACGASWQPGHVHLAQGGQRAGAWRVSCAGARLSAGVLILERGNLHERGLLGTSMRGYAEPCCSKHTACM